MTILYSESSVERAIENIAKYCDAITLHICVIDDVNTDDRRLDARAKRRFDMVGTNA